MYPYATNNLGVGTDGQQWPTCLCVFLQPIVPALFILSALYVLVNALVDPRGRWATVVKLGVTLPGEPVYHLSVGKSVCSIGQGHCVMAFTAKSIGSREIRTEISL